MAPLDIGREIERAIERSNELELMVANRQPWAIQTNRQITVVGYWALMVDYHRSVLFLLKTNPPLCGGGFALARPMVEALLRIHVVAGGSDCDLAGIRADKYRTQFEDVAEELDELFKMEFFAKTFNADVRRACTATRTLEPCR